MPEIRKEKSPSRLELTPTLWHCPRCDAFITVYSDKIIEIAICPICCDVGLISRGNFETILGMALQDRPSDAS
jgi:Zn-finger nucleic acid-binding protein